MRAFAADRQGGVLAGGILVLLLAGAGAASAGEVGGCPLFPSDSIWNTRVDDLPVHPSSAAWVASIGEESVLHPDFGSGEWPPGSGAPIGIPYATVGATQMEVPVSFLYADESDPGPYPIPDDVPVEGGPEGTGDRHVLVVETASCTLYELFDAHPRQGEPGWDAGSGAVFDLHSYALRPEGWTSADAAGLPILPGMVRYDEVVAGVIDHALRFTAPQTRRAYVWPARHFASSFTGAQLPPMGQRFRLRADYDLSTFTPRVQVVLTALKKYGMMLADNGSSWFLSGAPDARWDNDELRQLRQVVGRDFEAVDLSSLQVEADSSRAAPPCAGDPELTVADLSVLEATTFAACDEIMVGPNVAIYGPSGRAVLHAGWRVVIGELDIFEGAEVVIVTGLPLPSD